MTADIMIEYGKIKTCFEETKNNFRAFIMDDDIVVVDDRKSEMVIRDNTLYVEPEYKIRELKDKIDALNAEGDLHWSICQRKYFEAANLEVDIMNIKAMLKEQSAILKEQSKE